MREKLLRLAEAYRSRSERLWWDSHIPHECHGICKAVAIPDFEFTREEVTQVRVALGALPNWNVIGFKWPYDDWDSRAAWLETFAEGLR